MKKSSHKGYCANRARANPAKGATGKWRGISPPSLHIVRHRGCGCSLAANSTIASTNRRAGVRAAASAVALATEVLRLPEQYGGLGVTHVDEVIACARIAEAQRVLRANSLAAQLLRVAMDKASHLARFAGAPRRLVSRRP